MKNGQTTSSIISTASNQITDETNKATVSANTHKLQHVLLYFSFLAIAIDTDNRNITESSESESSSTSTLSRSTGINRTMTDTNNTQTVTQCIGYNHLQHPLYNLK
ncbi:hypothetical protein RF11_04926 [Thelohanellus kitauei]|uniref:Uncharacterized protein n=1 Tax=Thelohanellus kitauei TaxID=669202 RepID=A0A0C2N9I0_THEKT|nr:hypothetical protein RF11_08372 [Thelohanellus kitauei]KII70567.1 hypothetical protein RF11_04926 [Thelohanellus kitauei]